MTIRSELPCYAEAQAKLMMITSLYERPPVQKRHKQRCIFIDDQAHSD